MIKRRKISRNLKKKQTNVVPINMKEHKGLMKNYRPICLLPIFGKIFERLICNSVFN